MGWLAVTLAVFGALAALFLLTAYLLRFRLALEYAYPGKPRGSFGIVFLRYRKTFGFGEDASASESATPPDGEAAPPAARLQGQAGFLRVDFPRRWKSIKRRLRRAARRWAMDLPVWGILAGYLRRSAFRFVRLLSLGLDFLHVGTENIGAMARFASAWSAMRGMFPALAGRVEYGFNERPFALRLRVTGGCTGLGVLALALTLILTFPWIPLGRRFVHCWRHPRLNRWQRRLLSYA